MTEVTEERWLRVACAQLAARDLRDADRALTEALDAVDEAARQGADVVVLPECSYPAYVLAEDPLAPPLRSDSEVEEAFGERARSNRIAVAVGLAQGMSRGAGRKARNVAVLFDREGQVRLRTSKRFLWDFDQRWFEPGRVSPTADLDGVAVGALVCADLRLPEVPRVLALQGVQLVLDPTAWVSTGRHVDALTNPQPEFLMRVRALENGTWIAAANKVGVERGTVVYCGRSAVVAPDGSVVAMAGSRDPEVISCEVDPSTATGPPVRRRPELYALLTRPTPSVPAWDRGSRPIVPPSGSFRVGLLQADGASIFLELGSRRTVVEALGLDLVAAACTGVDPGEIAGELHSALGVPVAVGFVDGSGSVTGGAIAVGGRTTRARPTHGPLADPEASLVDRPVDLGELRLALLLGEEGLVPEVPRVLALAGAELLVWFAGRSTPLAETVARGRALEQRVYVGVIAGGAGDPGVASLADPEGRVVATGLEGRPQLVAGMVHVPVARVKEVVPGTDVMVGRQLEASETLLAPYGQRWEREAW